MLNGTDMNKQESFALLPTLFNRAIFYNDAMINGSCLITAQNGKQERAFLFLIWYLD